MSRPELVLVSACLAGLQTRYDNRIVRNSSCLERLDRCIWVPFCPEQLGGLPTPRPAADLVGGNGVDVLHGTARVLCRDGVDVTAAFVKGANQVLELARRLEVDTILLKARSPSCGLSVPGVTAALLRQNGFTLEEFG